MSAVFRFMAGVPDYLLHHPLVAVLYGASVLVLLLAGWLVSR